MRFWTRGSGTSRLEPALPTSSVGAAVAVAARRLPRTRPWYADVWVQMLRRKPLGTIGGVIVAGLLAAPLLPPPLPPDRVAPTSPSQPVIPVKSAPPPRPA